ncbi:BTB/POZ and MATH domain-containing protein 1-like [Triticum dicoccoides]|uniref:BTB/POZ and MATH domain-containing protein 1-like n=1 Tax=Triticum dicoccoides TaxID=85692 RepID=UPI0018905F82|nr:BTB/POZ and MATH domain-containing protein 1-like [Triticum dicoccoides]
MLPLCGHPRSGGLVTSRAYALLRYGGRLSPHAAFVWGTRAPSRVKFFCWLLVHRRINTRDALLRKTIVDRTGASCPVCSAELETADHLMFGCPFAREFWRAVGCVVITADTSVERLFALDVRAAVGDACLDTFVLLCCWHLWKHRNGVVFQAMVPSLDRFFERPAPETYVVDGYATFLCSIVVVNELGPDPVPASDLGDHLGRLLEDGNRTDDGMMMTTDVSLAVDGETFRAHRLVLAARSPVFKAMLFGSMMEATTTSSAPIVLHEITPAILGAMLRFMYTDAWPEDNEHVGHSSSIEMLQDLLAAADRYALDRLKLMCVRKLWDNMSIHTVVSILVYADTYGCAELKKKCLDFCARKENFKQVASTDGYPLFVLKFPSIFFELIEHKV